MADHGLGCVDDLVGDAAMQHQFTGENEERNGEKRKYVHARHHLLEADGDRKTFIKNGAKRRQADRKSNRDPRDEEADKSDTKNG
ncbi:hypothetical protein D3C87_1933370 [compost metagenome]